MKFSVVIPTFKGNDTLEIAISSILNQSYDDFEIIISDDNEIGSKEQIATELIIEKEKKKSDKIIYLKNGHHNGSYARNRGIKIANGDYITLLDDDDFYLTDYLKEANDYLNQNKDVELLFFDVVTITAENMIKIASYPSINSKSLLYGYSEIGTGSNLCFKNRADKKLLFDERYSRHQDIEFACKAMASHKYKWIEKIEIVKYYNQTDNYPNVDKALRMQKLLREDMLENNIISDNELKELEIKQLHALYHDLLVKNATKGEIKKVINNLKDTNSYRLIDNIIYSMYSVSKKIFNLFIKIYSKSKFNKIDKKLISDIKRIRKELEGKSL